MAKEDLQEHLPYQQASLVRQTLAERAQAEALGQTTRVEAADKILKGLGWKQPEKAPEVRRDAPPEARQAPAERTVTADAAAGQGSGERPRPRRNSA